MPPTSADHTAFAARALGRVRAHSPLVQNPGDVPRLREAGAAGAAVVSGICAAEDPGAAARAYADAWSRPPAPSRAKTLA
ncbi:MULTISPECIES: hypothetical protein [unclassified Streptomyces]|uniref:hypothetical protein n=1 Tax=unclassified Streptomyces TaxID=2593676 RepID=UPI00035DB171|nr:MULTISPECIES: hypothetical protein [unclassified Streptomyces]